MLIRGLHHLPPDLVAFQDAIKIDDYDQTVHLLGSDYHVVHQSNRANDGSGASVASRWPVVDVRQVDLRVTAQALETDFPYAALVLELCVPGPIGTLLLVNKRTS